MLKNACGKLHANWFGSKRKISPVRSVNRVDSAYFYEPKKKVHTKKFFNNFFFQATINLTINLQVIISRKFDSRKYKKILKD